MRALQSICVATTLNSLVLKALIFHLIIVKLVNTNFIQSLPKLLRKHAVMDLVCAMGECHTAWGSKKPRVIRVMCNILHPASDPLGKASDSRAMMTYPEMAAVIPAAGCLPHLSFGSVHSHWEGGSAVWEAAVEPARFTDPIIWTEELAPALLNAPSCNLQRFNYCHTSSWAVLKQGQGLEVKMGTPRAIRCHPYSSARYPDWGWGL